MLSKLETLSLSKNKVFIIPDSLGQLKSLKLFFADSCPIRSIPESILQIDSLITFYVNKDKLDSSSLSIINRLRDNGVIVDYPDF